jgi:hypothetical protein
MPAVTPPGYFTSGSTTQKCAPGTFRANWKTGTEAAACLSCGEGVKTDMTDRLAMYDILNPANMTYERITTSSDDCCECLRVFSCRRVTPRQGSVCLFWNGLLRGMRDA